MLHYTGLGVPFIMPPEDGDLLADWLSASYPDEFCASLSFDPGFIDELCAAGFIPMAVRDGEAEEILIPKLHTLRSVLAPSEVLVSRTARRESRRYALGLDLRFDEVLQACLATHGDDWLRPPLLAAWRELFATRERRRSRFSSMELYEDGELAAGEIGVFVGGCYTSLTGFRRASGSGTVQLVAAARFLEAAGAPLWDLGMPLDYKATLGARNVSRDEFLRLFREARSRPLGRPAGAASDPTEAALGRGLWPARALVDRELALADAVHE
jgi:Leu/Phe-tRNA-protein transferase